MGGGWAGEGGGVKCREPPGIRDEIEMRTGKGGPVRAQRSAERRVGEQLQTRFDNFLRRAGF